MPLAGVGLTVGANTAVATQTLASVTPGANRLELLAVGTWLATGVNPNTPTCTGCNLTWVTAADFLYKTGGTGRARITIFRAMGASPSTGALTIDWAAQTEDRILWSLVEYSGADTTGANGSGAIVQSATSVADAIGTSTSAALAALGSPNNLAYAVAAIYDAGAITPGGGYTQLHQQASGGNRNMLVEEKLNDTAPSASWTASVNDGMVALEIKAAASSGGGSKFGTFGAGFGAW